MFNCLSIWLVLFQIVISVNCLPFKSLLSNHQEDLTSFKLIDPFGYQDTVDIESQDEVKTIGKSDKSKAKCFPSIMASGGFDYTGIDTGAGGFDGGGLPPQELARRRQIAARRARARRLMARRKAMARRQAIARRRRKQQGRPPFPVGGGGVGGGTGDGSGGSVDGGGSFGGDGVNDGDIGGSDDYGAGNGGDTQYDQGPDEDSVYSGADDGSDGGGGGDTDYRKN